MSRLCSWETTWTIENSFDGMPFDARKSNVVVWGTSSLFSDPSQSIFVRFIQRIMCYDIHRAIAWNYRQRMIAIFLWLFAIRQIRIKNGRGKNESTIQQLLINIPFIIFFCFRGAFFKETIFNTLVCEWLLLIFRLFCFPIDKKWWIPMVQREEIICLLDKSRINRW